jgi:hypothetical protein
VAQTQLQILARARGPQVLSSARAVTGPITAQRLGVSNRTSSLWGTDSVVTHTTVSPPNYHLIFDGQDHMLTTDNLAHALNGLGLVHIGEQSTRATWINAVQLKLEKMTTNFKLVTRGLAGLS